MTTTPQAPVIFPHCVWSDQYSVGIVRLDDQHRKIFQMLNTLRQAMLDKKSDQVLAGIVNDLVQYAKTHFASEEAYFQMYAYPERDAHKQEHEEFTRKVRQFQEDLAKGRATLTLDVLKFLSDWVKNHVLGSDKKYGPYLNAKGVK
ncbi:MAG: bacteriohemerythrin [Thermoguttaceae bacterium]|nr:bacteriohemerythrin [Thermoguttaceae bacterium]MDW8078377.1 bacteriohemerythrin [Thermoguttaceae bacterium]